MRWLLVVTIALLSIADIMSQTVTSIEPSDNTTGVALSLDSIVIQFDQTIVASSIKNWESEYDDSEVVLGGVYLIPRIIVDSLPNDTLAWIQRSVVGTGYILSDSTFVLKLQYPIGVPNQQYVVLVYGLSTVEGSDTSTVPAIATVFTTANSTHKFRGTSADTNGVIVCGDTIWCRFDQPLPYASAGGVAIASILRIGSTSMADSTTISYEYDTLQVEFELTADSMALFCETDSMLLGEEYMIAVNLEPLTGDTSSHWVRHLLKLGIGGITLKVEGIDSVTSTPPGLVPNRGMRVISVYPGDTINISTPTTYGSYVFNQWHCPSNMSIHGSTNSNLNVAFDCSNLPSYDVVALYSLMTKDTFSISVDTSSYGTFTVSGWEDSLGGGVYTVFRGTEFALNVRALPDASNNGVFLHWYSPLVAGIHMSKIPIAVLVPGTNGLVGGVKWDVLVKFGNKSWYGGIAPCNRTLVVRAEGASFNSESHVDKVYPVSATPAVLTSTPPLTMLNNYTDSWTLTSPNDINQFVSFTITNSCWEIAQVTVNGQVQAGSVGVNTWSANIVVNGNPCEVWVVCSVRQKRYQLRIEMTSIDGGTVERADMDVLYNPQGKVISEWSSNNNQNPRNATYWEKVLEYKCGEVVDARPYLNQENARLAEKEIVGWKVASDYTSSAIIDAAAKKIQFTMDQNRKIQMLWKDDDFVAISLAILSRAPNDDTWEDAPSLVEFEINSLGAIAKQKELRDLRHEFEYQNPDRTVKPIIRFNKPVDEASLPDGLKAEDVAEYTGAQKDKRHDFNNNSEYKWSSNNGCILSQSDRSAEFRLHTDAIDPIEPWSSQFYRLWWTSSIHSSTSPSLSLSNPGNDIVRTTPPKLELEMHYGFMLSNHNLDGGLRGAPDIVYMITCGLASMVPNSAMKVDQPVIWKSGVIEAVESTSVIYNEEPGAVQYYVQADNNPHNFYGDQVGVFTPASDQGSFMVTVAGWDDDGTDPFSESNLSSLTNKINSVASQAFDPINWAAAAGSVAISFIAQAIKDTEDPEDAGQRTIDYAYEDGLWGGRGQKYYQGGVHTGVIQSHALATSTKHLLFYYKIALVRR